ncbi:hypothetical protein PVAND_008828 [Polypedilum vanderplanki]|uniref:Uncharacterized protein n=1 Tax=Polypedilum vanderplanki TaxID=319348 RepID=A0A9J6CBK5_POLVA|nr:hypothetical protein PVAND_008828 [Polypedilum vanderplanki]
MDNLIDFEPPFFDTISSDSVLENLCRKFITVRGDQKYKVDQVCFDNLSGRYNPASIFNTLTSDSILYTTNSGSISVEIEEKIKNILFESGKSANHYKDSKSALFHRDDTNYCVYLTTLRDNLKLCPMRGCGKAMVEDQLELHIENHQ